MNIQAYLNKVFSFSAGIDRHGLLRTGTAMTFNRAIGSLSGIGLAIVLSRELGAENYGSYIFALTLVHFLSLPIQMGLPTLLVRQIAIYRSQEDWGHLAGIVRWSLRFVLLTFCTIGILASVFYAFVPDARAQLEDAYLLYAFAFLLVGALSFMKIGGAILSGFERVFWGSLPDGVIRQVLLLLFVLIAIYFVPMTSALVMALHVGAVLCALAWAVFMIVRYCNWNPKASSIPRPRFQSRVWMSSLMPLSLAFGITLINNNIDIFMLGILIDAKEGIGFYSVAMKVSSIALIGQSILYTIISPKVAKHYAAKDMNAIKTIVSYTSKLAFCFTCVAILFLHFFGREIIEFLFGSDFSSASQLTLIRCYGYALAAMCGPAIILLNMTGNERVLVWIVGVMAALNALLNFLLIPIYGVEGAALATSFSVFISHVWMWFKVKKHIGLRSDVFG
ncbi:MAG: oligosaccharide flippase family protein [Rhizobiaceae bacterium]